MNDPALIWSYLASQPLLWLTATLAAYWIGDSIFRAADKSSLANPVLIAVIVLAVLLGLSGTSYQTYFEGAQFVHFMLGPATVCLALPLYDNLKRIRRALLPVLAALLVGSLTAVISALLIGRIFGLDQNLLASLAPKSTTAPVAIGIAERIGGQPTLTADGVADRDLRRHHRHAAANLLKVTDWRARGSRSVS